MRYIVTGAAGFIGANIVQALNKRGEKDIIVVDDLTQADKYRNLSDLDISDYLDKSEFLEKFQKGHFGKVRAVFHEGACSDTMETDGHYMMANNFRYTSDLLDICTDQKTPLLYASSAATYGGSNVFVEKREYEKPLNVYGYSKFLFDQVLRRKFEEKATTAQVVGFRYFNVYGPGEDHKGNQASPFHQFKKQAEETGCVKVFENSDKYLRDFIHVDEVIKTHMKFFNVSESGIWNLGTGKTMSFLDVAKKFSQNIIEIPMPDILKSSYQKYTCADMTKMKNMEII